ncbi:sucrase ferredoxin [Nocardia stercoris]|uniref:sucrase ferredoxin n=1 Tax=Nocardia stercoris TaxID=2483361 RepID=UPI003898ECB2
MKSVFEGLACSEAAADIPLPGSATHVTGWLCVEQPGAWGRDVLADQVLGAEITTELAARTKAARVRPTLIRRPGRHLMTGPRTVLLAAARPGEAWCERLEIEDLEELLKLDLQLLNGPAPGLGEPLTGEDTPVLVCAHGKRDQCCARLGRPIAARLAEVYPERVWECSHTGGHRFAPAMVLLPSGLTYGRIDGDAALSAVAALDLNMLSLTGFRGRSGHGPVQQVAEIAVRERISAPADALTVTPLPAESDPEDPAYAGTAEVVHHDGRRWRVTAGVVGYPPRPASCGAPAKAASAVVATDVVELG